ncbi:MAG TPA: methyltransferase [Bryobacteraceae bacterium]|nr:methyltransferase [Bryobacteraceae bacterium]
MLHSIIRIPDHPPLTVLRDFLLDAGYCSNRLSDELGLSRALNADFSNLAPLLERTSGEDVLHVLSRLFFVGWPVPIEICHKHIPAPILQLCLQANVVIADGAELSPNVIFVPFENVLLFAADAPRLRGSNPDVVMGPSSTTNLISKTLIRSQTETLLDIGTGTGVLATVAGSFSKQVFGTDINQRAIDFARFNAALNGISNAQFHAGDAFAPVDGYRFSRIVANPPFFITPRKNFTYSDSPLELDGFTHKLAVEAPDYLEEGGLFQMICEWVELEGEPWQARLRSWTDNRGCDVLVLKGPSSKPIDYAERRYHEAKALNTGRFEALLSERSAYFREHRIRQIMSGIITMRKRKGSNWFSVFTGDITVDSSKAIQERLDALTMLSEYTDAHWLDSRFYFAPNAAITQTQSFNGHEWQLNRIEISKPYCINDQLQVDATVLPTIELFDGRNTVAAIAERTADALSISVDESTTRCLALAKRLAASSFILPAAPRENSRQE